MPFTQPQTYIKINKIDANGNDNTATLSSLSTITVPFTNGTKVVYDIQGTTQHQDYFTYTVDYIPESQLYTPDFTDVDYNFRGKIRDVETLNGPNIIPGMNNDFWFKLGTSLSIEPEVGYEDYVLSLNELYPNLVYSTPNPLFPSISNIIHPIIPLKINTYPQKQITITIEGNILAKDHPSQPGFYPPDITFHTMMYSADGSQIRYPSSSTGTPVGYHIVPSNTQTYFKDVYELQVGDVQPGDYLTMDIRYLNGFNGPGMNGEVLFTNTSVKIDSTPSSNSNTPFSIILEPTSLYQFNNSDCDVTLGEAVIPRPNNKLQDIDYSYSQTSPLNFESLSFNTATRASVPRSNYSSLAHINSRYLGSKLGSQHSDSVNVTNLNHHISSSINGNPEFNFSYKGDSFSSAGTNVIYFSSISSSSNVTYEDVEFTDPITQQTSTFGNIITNVNFQHYFTLEYLINSEGETVELIKDENLRDILMQNLLSTPITNNANKKVMIYMFDDEEIDFPYQPFEDFNSITKIINGPKYVFHIEKNYKIGGRYTTINNDSIESLGTITTDNTSTPESSILTTIGQDSLQNGVSNFPTGSGIIYPKGIEFTEAKDNPSKSKEILKTNNVI
jgi:hypothetical protein